MKRIGAILLAGCLTLPLYAQPEFDAASIKPDPGLPKMTMGPFIGNGKVTGAKVTLLELLMAAYDVTAPQVAGPRWLTDDATFHNGAPFTVIARSASENSSKDELRLMLQTLLKQRFHVVAHEETREIPTYDLVVAKGGLKMMKYPPDPDAPTPPRKTYPGAKNISSQGGTLTTAQIALYMSRAAGRPIVDKTGLKGKYTFFVAFSQNLQTTSDSGPELGPPDLLTAIQEEMGLTLQPSKASMTVIVVDQVDKTPTEN